MQWNVGSTTKKIESKQNYGGLVILGNDNQKIHQTENRMNMDHVMCTYSYCVHVQICARRH